MIQIEAETVESQQSNSKSTIFGWIRFILILAVLFFIFRFAVSITVINGESMEPTFEDNQMIMTNNLFYSPDKGDIILYRDDNGYNVIKRVIATQNDKVEIIDGITKVNDEPVQEEYKTGDSADMPPVVVQEGTYFVMGDNRTPGASLDSRSDAVGTIKKKDIIGKYLFKIYPF